MPPPSATGGEGKGEALPGSRLLQRRPCCRCSVSRQHPGCVLTSGCICAFSRKATRTGAFRRRGVQLRQTLVLLLSCWELPPLSFLSSETKLTESPGSRLRCGLSPRVGELYQLTLTMGLIFSPPPNASSSACSCYPELSCKSSPC